MKINIFAVLGFTLFTVPAFGQIDPYRIDFMKPTCKTGINPYTMKDVTVCTHTELTNPHSVFSIVQASIGDPSKELAFVVLLNMSEETNLAVIEYTIAGKEGTFYQYVYLKPKERFAIGLHVDPEMAVSTDIEVKRGANYSPLPKKWNFSIVTKFEKTGDMELVWHQSSTYLETGSKPGKRVN